MSDETAAVAPNGASSAKSNGQLGAASHLSTAQNATNGAQKPVVALNGSSNGVKSSKEALLRSPTYFGHDREEVTRILIQALSDMGYQHAAESVSNDSGCDLESPSVAAFRSAVLSGAWADAEQLLSGAGSSEDRAGEGNGLVLAPGSDKDLMRFWLRQQKFLELLEQRNAPQALSVLRRELTPLNQDTSKLHFLSSLLMCGSVEDFMAKANWDGANGQSRRTLLSELSRKCNMYQTEACISTNHDRLYITVRYVTRESTGSFTTTC